MAVTGEKEYNTEFRIKWPDGSVHFIKARGEVYKNADGIPARMLGANFDITEQKSIQEALKESKVNLDAALSSMTDALFMSNLKGDFVEFNNAFATIHKFKNKEECAKTLAEYPEILEVYLPSGELARLDQWAVPRALSGETAQNQEYTLKRKDTGETWVGSYSFAPIRDIDGKIVGSVVAGRDITDLKIIQEALKENVSRLELAMQSANMAWWEMDIITGKVIFDKRKSEMLEFPAEKFNHYNDFIELLHPVDVPHAMNAMKQHIDGITDKYEIEYRILTKSGVYKWFYDIGAIIKKDKQGRPLKITGLVLDITDRKRSEENIRKLNDELEQRVIERTAQLVAANKELEAFSYSVSHDLRAPLRGINGFVQILMEDFAPKLDNEAQRICKVIQDNSQKMGQLIDELLAFSRLSRTEMEAVDINMQKLVHSICQEYIDADTHHRLELHIGQLCNTTGDQAMIKQVWVNLILNAVKYTSKQKKPIIKISCNSEGTNHIYCIQDNGVGFDMQYVNKLFGVFQRLHSTKDFEGTGVGLAIVQRIINRHGGRVWAEGQVNKGASFYFSLPHINNANSNLNEKL